VSALHSQVVNRPKRAGSNRKRKDRGTIGSPPQGGRRMTPEQEPRIRELIKLFVGERDPEKRKILATELEPLLTRKLEDRSTPWPIVDEEARDD